MKGGDTTINYSLKREVLENGFVKVYRSISKSKFFNHDILYKKPFTDYTFEEACNLESAYSILFPEIWKECKRINNSDIKRVARLKNRINSIITNSNFSYFLTLTFTDKVLKSTSKKTRRVYVTRFLNSISLNFVANIDFGEENGREHYHAVVASKNALNNVKMAKLWQYGFSNAKKINKTINKNDIRLAKYISKLTNHAIKNTTKNNKIIYSKPRVLSVSPTCDNTTKYSSDLKLCQVLRLKK